MPEPPRSPGRRDRRHSIGALLVAALVLLVGQAVALAVVVVAATATSEPVLLVAVGALTVAATGSLAGRIVRRSLVGAMAGLVVGAAFYLVPMGDPQVPPASVPGMEVAELPTGSRIAFVRIPARAGVGAGTPRAPIVFVHGGPGIADMPGDAEAFGRLAATGRDVIVYDQVGSGHSSRLEDPSEYVLERDVDDLEALLDRLGVTRPVLIGHSYGGTLVAAYLARHPDGAERVVFSAPGEIRSHPTSYASGMTQRIDGGRRVALYSRLLQPRSLLTYVLSQVAPRAGHALIGDGESDARFDTLYALTEPGLRCATDAPSPAPHPHGLGFFTNARLRTIPDLRPGLARATIPALVIKPQCDYLPWSYGVEIVEAMPNAAMIELVGAGHSTYIEQPESFFSEVEAFLDDRPLPIPRLDDLRPPADLRGPA